MYVYKVKLFVTIHLNSYVMMILYRLIHEGYPWQFLQIEFYVLQYHQVQHLDLHQAIGFVSQYGIQLWFVLSLITFRVVWFHQLIDFLLNRLICKSKKSFTRFQILSREFLRFKIISGIYSIFYFFILFRESFCVYDHSIHVLWW